MAVTLFAQARCHDMQPFQSWEGLHTIFCPAIVILLHLSLVALATVSKQQRWRRGVKPIYRTADTSWIMFSYSSVHTKAHK